MIQDIQCTFLREGRNVEWTQRYTNSNTDRHKK
jgi:hypothetical protein